MSIVQVGGRSGFRRLAAGLSCLAGLLLVSAGGARAERLPIASFTTADGLASDSVRRIVRDSRGYLWICHRYQLSRFDGYRFTTYGAESGLPPAAIGDFLETRDGTYLVGTARGIVRFDPKADGSFFSLLETEGEPAPSITALLEDRAGRLWAGASSGLFRVEIEGSRARFHPIGLREDRAAASRQNYVSALLPARDGSLWVGARYGLYRIGADARVERFTKRNGLPADDVRSLVEDGAGRIWAATAGGLARLVARPDPEGSAVSDVLGTGGGLRDPQVSAALEARDGTIWIGAVGLGELRPKQRREMAFRWYFTENGLVQNDITCLAEDSAGDLWLGTEGGGLMRLARRGLSSYAEAEGLANPRIASIFESRAGDLCAAASDRLYRLDRDRFVATKPNVPPENLGWGWYQWVLQDHLGDWWVPSRRELYRFHGAARVDDLGSARPASVYGRAEGLSGEEVFRVYEDSRGDLWLGTVAGAAHDPLARWERRSGTSRRFTAADGYPKWAPTAFREDGRGSLWIGMYLGGVARYRGGRFEIFAAKDGCPKGLVRAIELDRRGRLWIATEEGGVARVDDPAASPPRFETLDTRSGLSSSYVTSMVEDDHGRLYFGTDRGVDRLDPATGRVRHFTMADGLPNAFVNVAHRDRGGDLWFGTLRGIARMRPGEDAASPPPPVFIGRVRAGGVPHRVSELGETEVAPARLPPDRNRVQIEFGGIAFGAGGELRYQYMLEGADRDWSERSASRSVDYANLAPGRYRFRVRAVAPDGRVSERPAVFAFVVLRPFWQRWWFLGAIALVLAAAAEAIHRARVTRMVELERVRTRIATDLHDDIGASLSQIAILSEVAHRKAGEGAPATRDALSRIAETSRELVDSMSDIVWAINPRRDRLSDVVQRMRRFANDACSARDVALAFRAPAGDDQLKLGPDVRRQAYLVLKESVNNAARHSGCSRVAVELRIEGDRLVLEVRDDGRGFDPGADFEGHGLASMRRRAAELGGTLDLLSNPGEGTRVRLEVPVGRRPGIFRRRSLPD